MIRRLKPVQIFLVQKTSALSFGVEMVTIFKKSSPSLAKNLPLRSGISERVLATTGWICAACRALWTVLLIQFMGGNTPSLDEGRACRLTASTDVVASRELTALSLTFDMRCFALHLEGSGPWVWHDWLACDSSATDLHDAERWIRPLQPYSLSPHLSSIDSCTTRIRTF